MGRYSDTELARGTVGSGRMTIEQLEYAMAEERAEAELDRISNLAKINTMIDELDSNEAKYNVKDMRFITRDATDQVVWLEKGNSSAGLEHIVSRHANDFRNKLGIEKYDIANTLYDIVKTGQIVSNRIKLIKGRKNYERIYKYQGQYYVLAGIGSNGFLVSAYPISVKGE